MQLGGTSILLVEDTADVRDAFTVLLRSEGAEVTPTSSGREAVECLARRSFDVVVTDLGLPDVTGDALIRQILATASRRPRIVAVTGYGEPHQERARAAGADVVLSKPVEWTVLLQELHPEPGDTRRAHGIAA
jgi:two-component system CheB/CheR fusion protein